MPTHKTGVLSGNGTVNFSFNPGLQALKTDTSTLCPQVECGNNLGGGSQNCGGDPCTEPALFQGNTTNGNTTTKFNFQSKYKSKYKSKYQKK